MRALDADGLQQRGEIGGEGRHRVLGRIGRHGRAVMAPHIVEDERALLGEREEFGAPLRARPGEAVGEDERRAVGGPRRSYQMSMPLAWTVGMRYGVGVLMVRMSTDRGASDPDGVRSCVDQTRHAARRISAITPPSRRLRPASGRSTGAPARRRRRPGGRGRRGGGRRRSGGRSADRGRCSRCAR